MEEVVDARIEAHAELGRRAVGNDAAGIAIQDDAAIDNRVDAAELVRDQDDREAKVAREAWEARLATLQVTGGTKTQQRVFYTALFRCCDSR